MDDNELCGGHHFSQNASMCEPDRFVSNLLHERSRYDRRFRAQCWEEVAFNKRRESFPTLLVIIHFVALLTLLLRSNSPGFWFQQRISLTIAVLLLYRLYNTVVGTSSGGSRLRIAGLLGHLFIDTPPPFSSNTRGFGVAFVRIVTCAMYAATGLNKIIVEGSEWVTGTAVRRTLSCKSHIKYPWDQVGVLLPDFITVTLTSFVVVLEIGGAILLTMGVSDGWDHTLFLTIIFHIIPCSARRNYAGCFVQPDVLRKFTFVFTL